jgi:hypothetical protein
MLNKCSIFCQPSQSGPSGGARGEPVGRVRGFRIAALRCHFSHLEQEIATEEDAAAADQVRRWQPICIEIVLRNHTVLVAGPRSVDTRNPFLIIFGDTEAGLCKLQCGSRVYIYAAARYRRRGVRARGARSRPRAAAGGGRASAVAYRI